MSILQKKHSIQTLLYRHKTNIKYCLKIQNQLKGIATYENKEFKCQFCLNNFSSKQNLMSHIDRNCMENIETVRRKRTKIEELIKTNSKNIIEMCELKIENKLLREELSKNEQCSYVEELQDKLYEVELTAINQKNDVITFMTKKFIKKQPRKQFDCSNVIYILTTPSLQKIKDIVGKSQKFNYQTFYLQ